MNGLLEGEVDYPRAIHAVPPGSLKLGAYTVQVARSACVLETVQRFRFEVFNLELGEGLDTSLRSGRDEDAFDAHCHHIVVSHVDDGVVGTYRLMTSELAGGGIGFYSETEYDLANLPRQLREESVELGRACVHAAHRNGTVLRLLWRAIARYMTWNKKRFLFGCCSVPTLDEAAVQRLHHALGERRAVHSTLRVDPLPSVRCSNPALAPGDVPPLPRLFESYLALGATVCGGPAVDRDFKVIDFFLVLDTEALAGTLRATFFRERGWV